MAQPTIEDYLLQLNSIRCPLTSPQVSTPSAVVSLVGHIDDINLANMGAFDPEQYYDYKTADKAASAALRYFLKEAGHVIKLNELLKEGQALLPILYSYRSTGRAIPQVQQDQTNKGEMYIRMYTVLRPLVARMRSFMEFRDRAVARVVDVLTSLIPEIRDKDYFPTAQFLEALARVLDMFVMLDTIKNTKGSMNNDFSMYKRALPNLPSDMVHEDETQMHNQLYFFLAQHDQFSAALKKSLNNLHTSYEDIIVDLLTLCADRLEKGVWTVPETKWMYLKAMAFGLYVLDGEGEDHDITKRKKLKIDRFGKIFKQYPVVPLFGDMPIQLSSIYGKGHLGTAKWDLKNLEDTAQLMVARSYGLVHSVEEAKAEFADFTALFARTRNSLRKSIQKNESLSYEESVVIYNVALQGLRLLSSFTIKVLEQKGFIGAPEPTKLFEHNQSAWKYANPTNGIVNPAVPVTAISYELAVRYNYTAEEKRALVEYIYLIKCLAALLNGLDRSFLEAINQNIYVDLQGFVKVNLTDFIAHATKKKRPAQIILQHIRDTTLDGPLDDNNSGRPFSNSLPHSKSKSSSPSMLAPTSNTLTTPRVSPISPTQLHFVRALLEYCFSDKAKGMKGGLMKEKDFKDAHVEVVDGLIERSWAWEVMSDFGGSVAASSDLADLWYKEFYLELSKQVQFPISMSLPWILTDYILDSSDPEMFSHILYPFDLYNDAAYRTLYKLKSRYIYDEIVAEVNLCFDQFIVKLAKKIFLHFKKAAALSVLSPDLKTEMEQITYMSGHAPKDLPFDIFDALLRQKSYQLLGRSLDLSELLNQNMNQFLRKSIDTAISRYEGNDLNYIMELDTLLRSTEATHRMLSKYMNLDPFEDMLAEMDESVGVLSAGSGRIATHTAFEFINDFVPNFCWNSVTGRFMRGAVSYAAEPQRASHQKAPPAFLYGTKALHLAFNTQNGMYRDFIGEPHFRAITKWVGEKGVPVILAEITRHVEAIIRQTMTAYIRVIQKGTPHTLKLPLFEYGTAGSFEYFAAHLKPLATYPDLKSEVLQAFREVGNIVASVRLFEDVLTVNRTRTYVQAGGIIPFNPEDRTPRLINTIPTLDNTLPSADYSMPFTEWTDRAAAFHMPTPSHALFGPFLSQIRNSLISVSAEWQADGHIDNPKAFFRVWSALQFVFCLPSVTEPHSTRELFGDGLSWAGCTFIHLLNQVGQFIAFDFNNHILSVQRADKKLGGLTFGAGGNLFGGTGAAALLSLTSKEKQAGTVTDVSTPAGLAAISNASGIRPDVIQFLENAAFFSNVNEAALGVLEGVALGDLSRDVSSLVESNPVESGQLERGQVELSQGE
ncbi:Cytoplasmic FMR1-interacting protein 2 [Rhizophlyctis rosea]|nr:Cytoplasmic FMR1-interacting protein 2 [Rhizophlyctis rosea]